MADKQIEDPVQNDANETAAETAETTSLYDRIMQDNKLKAAAIAILVIILAAVGAFLVINRNNQALSAQEQELVASAFKIADLDSGIISLSASGSSSETGDFDVVAEIQFVDGKYLVDAEVTVDGVLYKGSIFLSKDSALFKIVGVEDLLTTAFGLGDSKADTDVLDTFTPYDDQWILITSTDLADVGLPEIPDINELIVDQQTLDDTRESINKYDFFDITMLDEERTIGDQALACYEVTINPVEAQKLVNEFSETTTADNSQTALDNSFSTSDVDLDEFSMAAVKVWTDGEFLRAVELSETSDDGSMFSVDIEIKSINPELALEAPQAENSLQDILEEFFSTLFSGFEL